MQKTVLITSGIFIASQLIGCASIVSGSHQRISVTTLPVQGAQCSLENNKGKWRITHTPGSANIHRSENNLTVICEKKGYSTVTSQFKSEINKAAYGNLLLGGIVGGAIDKNNGAAFEYPANIEISLKSQKQ